MLKRIIILLFLLVFSIGCGYQKLLVRKSTHMNISEMVRMIKNDVINHLDNKEFICENINVVNFESFSNIDDYKENCYSLFDNMEVVLSDLDTTMEVISSLYEDKENIDEWVSFSIIIMDNIKNIICMLSDIGINVPRLYFNMIDEYLNILDSI